MIRLPFLRFGMLFVAVMAGILVMVIAQDVQRLQRQQAALTLHMAENAERLHVLEAEWAYLTRPSSLVAALNRVEPDAQWVPMRGEKIVSLEAFLDKAQTTRVAALVPPAP